MRIFLPFPARARRGSAKNSSPTWKDLGLPWLVATAINIVFIVGAMVDLVSPVPTKARRWYLLPSSSPGQA